MKKWVKVRVPASTSNLGSGFDSLGLALSLYNEVGFFVTEKSHGLKVDVEGEGFETLPKNQRNLIWRAALKVFKKLRFPFGRFGFHIKSKNRIPLARGLGSSAAAALSGAMAANVIAGERLSQDQILSLVTELEGHPDNAAPQIFGGLCISAITKDKIEVLRLKPPAGTQAVVCVPNFELATEKARAAIPEMILHKDAVFNVSRAALLIGAMATGQSHFYKTTMEDRLHHPYRKKFIRGYDHVVESAEKAGALGVAISGAGPSIFAFAPYEKARKVGEHMEKAFENSKIKAKSILVGFDLKGAEVFSK